MDLVPPSAQRVKSVQVLVEWPDGKFSRIDAEDLRVDFDIRLTDVGDLTASLGLLISDGSLPPPLPSPRMQLTLYAEQGRPLRVIPDMSVVEENERGDLIPAEPLPADAEFPDWVMLGFPMRTGGVQVFASTELDHARLSRETVGLQRLDTRFGKVRLPIVETRLTADLREYASICAADYPEAIRSLSEHWQPRSHQPELPAGE